MTYVKHIHRFQRALNVLPIFRASMNCTDSNQLNAASWANNKKIDLIKGEKPALLNDNLNHNFCHHRVELKDINYFCLMIMCFLECFLWHVFRTQQKNPFSIIIVYYFVYCVEYSLVICLFYWLNSSRLYHFAQIWLNFRFRWNNFLFFKIFKHSLNSLHSRCVYD